MRTITVLMASHASALLAWPPPRSWVKIAIAVLLAATLYFHVAIDLFQEWWTDPALSQGLLIPPLAIYIAWLRRSVTLAEPGVPDNRGLILVFAASLLFLIGKLGAEFFLQRISMVVLLVALIWTFWGLRRLRTLAFALLLLATMVPIPRLLYNILASRLQLFASDMSTSLAQFLGVSTYRDGNVVYLANMSLGVEEACSGLNSLSALMVASLLLGYLQCTTAKARVILFLVSFPLSIAVNVVRVAGTAVLADYHEDFAMGFYHSFSGWLIFIVGYGVLAGLAHLLSLLLDRKKTPLAKEVAA